MEKEIKFEPFHEFGDLMTIEDFADCVKCGGFIDYDGDGDWATKDKISNLPIWPSKFKEMNPKNYPSWATHVMWYNR